MIINKDIRLMLHIKYLTVYCLRFQFTDKKVISIDKIHHY